MGVTMRSAVLRRNPGPSWGYGFLRAADFVLPECIFRPLRGLGTLIAAAAMPAERRHSRDYLGIVLEREPTFRDVFRHFFSFEETLMRRLCLANGRHYECEYDEGADAFRTWMNEQTPMLLGTMHVGVSDMLGFQLANRLRNPIYLVRLRVANSHDTDALANRLGAALRFIWVNEPQEMLYALKDALASPSAVAVQCDRLEHGARAEAFEFLGKKRLFPFTIYHLALIFDRSVLLSFGLPTPDGRSRLFASDVFRPDREEPREEALRRAREHFQGFLRLLETKLRENPYLWFNFTQLNPVAGDAARAA
jgi:predicted LPLAT superfamily acyltransferase